MRKLKKWIGEAYLNTDARFKIFMYKNRETLYAEGRKNYKQELKNIATEE